MTHYVRTVFNPGEIIPVEEHEYIDLKRQGFVDSEAREETAKRAAHKPVEHSVRNPESLEADKS